MQTVLTTPAEHVLADRLEDLGFSAAWLREFGPGRATTDLLRTAYRVGRTDPITLALVREVAPPERVLVWLVEPYIDETPPQSPRWRRERTPRGLVARRLLFYPNNHRRTFLALQAHQLAVLWDRPDHRNRHYTYNHVQPPEWDSDEAWAAARDWLLGILDDLGLRPAGLP